MRCQYRCRDEKNSKDSVNIEQYGCWGFTRMRKHCLFSLCFIFILFLISSCSLQTSQENNKQVEQQSIKEETLETDFEHDSDSLESEPEILEREITFSAIGDILIHDRVYNDAYSNGEYDFLPMLELVKNYLNDTTITFANQETMIGGVEHGLSSYPPFNSPVEVGDALKDVGVNIVSIANNHTLDRGEAVIQSAIRHWESIDMMYVGSYEDDDDRNQRRIVDTDEGITVGFLAYTYGTNGIPVPEGKEYLVNLIDKEIIANDVNDMKTAADVIIISLHFGIEYDRMPNEEQKDLVQFVADLGVDAVIGHHPHVLQPTEWVTGENGNETFVIYSLGNFLSGQDQLYRQIGGIVKLTIKKEVRSSSETIALENPRFLPTYVDIPSGFKVFPLKDVTDEQLPGANGHYQEIKAHMSQWMPELDFYE